MRLRWSYNMLQKIVLRICPAWYALDAVVVLAIVLAVQYIFDFPPCALCIGQRFPWVLLCILALVAGRAEQVLAYKTRNVVLVLASLTMVGSAGFGVYHAGIQYGLWHAVVACGGNAPLEIHTHNLLQAVQDTTLVACDSKDPIILGATLPVWNALISTYMAISIAYMAWVKSR